MAKSSGSSNNMSAEGRAIDKALKSAVREALERHARLGEQVVICRNGRPELISADEALRLHDEEAERDRAR